MALTTRSTECLKAKKVTWAGSSDRIRGLPDNVAQHVHSFLAAEEAVRSCVLAQRWRHLWKSMPVLRVTRGRPAQDSHRWMDHPIVLRSRSPLDACLLNFGEASKADKHYVNLWIRYALLCKVRVLNVVFRDGSHLLTLSRLPAISQNLTNLELANVRLDDNLCASQGLSAATNLKLIAEPGLIILQRDLRQCPTFCKIKRLLLSEWSLAGNHHALICILQHTPILENLILQLKTTEDTEQVKATYNLLEQSFALGNLKTVEIACEEVM
ncbi:unnamed protein product [Alopecurus aequalis]